MNRYLETEMVTSIATIVLVILCIAIFIAYGAHALFYALGVVTLVVGFSNAWLIARSGKQGAQVGRWGARKRR